MKTFKIRFCPIAFVILFLQGCSGTLERMESWMGVSRAAVIKSLGEPNARFKTDFGDVLQFHRYVDNSGQMNCKDDFTLTDDIVTTYASNCGLWGGFFAPVFNQP